MISVKVLQAPYGDLTTCMELAKVHVLNQTQFVLVALLYFLSSNLEPANVPVLHRLLIC
jgi:hypothetical protein